MRTKWRSSIISLTAELFAVGCLVAGVSLAASASPSGQTAGGATGVITGKILFRGKGPKLQQIYMNRDPECERENQGRTVYVQDGEVNANGTLPNVFVYVKSGVQGKHFAVPSKPVVLDQQGCIFVPHVLGIMVGQTLKVLNSDFTTHNVHGRSNNNTLWNKSQPPGAAPFYEKFAHPEIMVPVSCNEHPWMKAYIGVVTTPYYAVTGPRGMFTIKGVPEGEYTVEAWTATFGTQQGTIHVRANQTTTLDLTFHSR